MSSPDIRAGVALLLAALNADGRSLIQNVVQIDRGYYDIDGRLNALGAKIIRCEEYRARASAIRSRRGLWALEPREKGG